jgi:hypothetical protein
MGCHSAALAGILSKLSLRFAQPLFSFGEPLAGHLPVVPACGAFGHVATDALRIYAYERAIFQLREPDHQSPAEYRRTALCGRSIVDRLSGHWGIRYQLCFKRVDRCRNSRSVS